MTISATGSSTVISTSSTTLLGVLAEASSNAAQVNSQIELSEIDNDIQNRLNTQIAALQNTPDNAVTTALQAQITAVQKQSTTITDLATQYGSNDNTLSDLQNQLATMQTAITNGDGTSFDTALAAANIDVSDLTLVTPMAPFQPDQVLPLKDNGLGISDSSTYDLSTPAGQAAASAAVQSTQNLVGQVFQATGANQILAGSLNAELSTQTNALNTTLQQMQQQDSTATNDQVQNLTYLAQNQEHLIELALGNTQLLTTTLTAALNPPETDTSPFEVLQNSVGATPSSSQNSTPAILSLLT